MKLCKCPICNAVPKIGYSCGEYFVHCEDMTCSCGGVNYSYMSSCEESCITDWNIHVSYFLNISFLLLKKGLELIKLSLYKDVSDDEL